MNSKMTIVKRKHKKTKLRKAKHAAQSRIYAKQKTKDAWERDGLIPVYKL